MGLFKGLFSKKSDGVTAPSSSFVAFLGRILSVFGRSQEEVLSKAYIDNDIVFAGVNIITEKIKWCPILLNEVVNEQKLNHYIQYSKSCRADAQVKSLEHRSKALREVESHPVLDLLKRPNHLQSWSEFIEDWAGNYNLFRDAYIYLDIPKRGMNAGQVVKMWSLPAYMVDAYTTGDYFNPVKHYYFDTGKERVEIPLDRIIHYKNWNPRNGEWKGLSPFDVARRVVQRNTSSQEAQTSAFQNGGTGILISGDNPDMEFTQEQIDLLNKRIVEKMSGVNNYRKVQAVSGSVKVHKIGDTLSDMQLVESDKADIRKIATVLGIRPVLLGDVDNAKYSNMEEAQKQLITGVVMPQLRLFIEKLSPYLLKPYEKRGKLFLEPDTTVYPELQPDLKLMMEVYGKPKLTGNEVRSVFQWDALNEAYMDKVIIDSNQMLLDDIEKQDAQQTEQDQEGQEDK